MKEIKAKEGYFLTQSAEVANEERIYVSAVKGANVNEDDWREATIEEVAAWKEWNEENNKTIEI